MKRILLLTLLFLIACSQTEHIEIGAVLPMTGVSSEYGEYTERGIRMALEEINAAGGLDGIPVRIILEDSQSRIPLGVAGITKLIQTNNLSVIIAGPSSSETLAEAPIAEKNKRVLLAVGSAAPAVRDAGDYIFRAKTSVDKELEKLVTYAHDSLNISTLSILYVFNDYGEGIRKFGELYFPGTVTGVHGFPAEQTTFQAELTKVRAEGAEAILLGGWPRNSPKIIKEAAELGLDVQFLSPGGNVHEDIIEIAGEYANGLIYIDEFLPEGAPEWVDKFREKYGVEPNQFSAMAYDVTYLLVDLIKDCGQNADCIRDELYGLEAYSGVSATFSFDEKGDVEKPLYMMTIREKKFTKY